MGYGPMTQLVKEHATKYPNIHFQPAVKPNEVLSYTQSADVGLSLIENCCLSYYYSLPNNFFEYMMSEIPQVVSNFPDMSAIINAHDIGWAINVNEEELIRVIKTVSPEVILEKRQSWELSESLHGKKKGWYCENFESFD
jgi:glycosyltransferase involved in cell wall biosynthesis